MAGLRGDESGAFVAAGLITVDNRSATHPIRLDIDDQLLLWGTDGCQTI